MSLLEKEGRWRVLVCNQQVLLGWEELLELDRQIPSI